MVILVVIFKVFFIYLMADFATGIFHFYADQFGQINGKFMSKSVNLLLLHHVEPGKILTQTYWELTRGVYKFATIIFPVSLFFGFSWEFLLFLIISAQANIVHRWSHYNYESTPFLAKLLFRINMIQGRTHHAIHHRDGFNSYYCVMSPFLNPILEKTNFWNRIIKLLNFMGVYTTHKKTNF